jgi:hypothetical protein
VTVQVQAFLKIVHILLIVTWLGMDIGVFISSFWLRDKRLGPETRLQIGRLASLLDMGPRSSLILIFAIGLLLALNGGFLPLIGQAAAPLGAAVVVLSLVWLWAVWQQYFAVHALAAGHDLGRQAFFVKGFRRIDLLLRIGLATILFITGLLAATGTPLATASWLNWKISLFGVVILAGVAIRLVADQFPVALGEIGRLGSTPEREARLNRALLRAYPFVLGIWALLIVMVALAVARPT